MDKFKKKVEELMIQNRRVTNGSFYTVPSPDSYPYQWFWDSCFHAIILSSFSLPDAKNELSALIKKQFDNGMIPHMIYWKKQSKSDFPVIKWGKKDTSTITQPPMLAYAVWQIYQKDKQKEFLRQMYPSLIKLYHYFLSDRDPHVNHLIGIINPDESGEDNSPRFDIGLGLPPKHTEEINYKKRIELVDKNRECNFDAPFCMRNFFWVKDVPINAIMVENLMRMSDIAIVLDNQIDADYFFNESRTIAQSMRNLMLEDGIFWPLYFDKNKKKYQKIKVKTWAMFAPLFAKIVSEKEASFLIENYLLNKDEFNTPYKVPTVSQSDPSFDPQGFWRGPVWIATNWFIVKGLLNYGYKTIANEIIQSSLQLLERNGFREQFNPLTGEGMGARNFTWGGMILDIL